MINFNYIFYINRYIDLKDFNNLDAYNHFLNNGINEKRIFNKLLINFDYNFYINHYIDLKDLNWLDACNHFINDGIKEKRIFNKLLIDFDHMFYINHYNDLKDFNWLDACNHYINHGINEKRQCNNNLINLECEIKFSIIMAYFNRKEQTILTFNQFENFYANKYNFEVIIVDDCSDDNEKLNDILNNYSFKIKYIELKDKNWINPVVPNNVAISNISDDVDVVIFQNPETFHCGDILRYANNIKLDEYFIYPVFNSPSYEENEKLKQLFENSCDNYFNEFISKIDYNTYRGEWDDRVIDEWKGWLQHKNFNNRQLHFLTAISKTTLNKVGGFCNEMKDGLWYDDDEFLSRIKKVANCISIDSNELVGIHQKHTGGSNENMKTKNDHELRKKNLDILNKNIKNNIIYCEPNIDLDYKIDKNINYLENSNPIIIYYSKTNYELLFQRPHQIMRFYDKNYNKIFIGNISSVKYENKFNLYIVPYLDKHYILKLLNNNTIIYYTDPRLFDEVDKLPGKKLFDLIDAPIDEFKVWKPNLEKCVKNSDYVIYSHPDLVNFLNEIDDSIKYNYISNACDYEHFSKAKNRIDERPVDFPETEKPILGYYGAFSEWLDYDIIRKYADEGNYYIVMIGGIPEISNYNIRFEHKNITWLNHKSYDELPYYLSWFDKCFLPFKDCELTKYVNPCKLWEYMATGKEIIKYNVNMNVDEIITYENVCDKIKTFVKNYINLSIVLLCFNKLEYTRQCIDSVLRNTITDSYELIIVNNGSTDGTYDYLNEIKNDTIKVIHNELNLGFSKGMNIGAKNAHGEYLILLNNDTIVGEGWDIELIKTLESDENIFAVTPITNFSGNESKIDVKHNSPDDFFVKVTELQIYFLSKFESNALALFCGCFRNYEFKNIGYLDENYYNGWEDDDLYEKILKYNKKVFISPLSIVYHFGNITVGKDAFNNINNPNKLYFEKKWNKKWSSHWVNNDDIFNNIYKFPSCAFYRNILITGNDDGGSYFWANYNLKYFKLIKNISDFNLIKINENTKIFINSFLLSDVTLDYLTKLKNKFKFKIIVPIHDYYWFCDILHYYYNTEIHNIYLKKNRKIPEHLLQLYKITDEFIISTNTIYENIKDLIPVNYRNKFSINYSYWYDNYHNSFIMPSTKLINNNINIGCFVHLDECKGLEQVNFLKNNIKTYENYEINYFIVNDNIEVYKNNNRSFIELVNKYNINGFLLLNKWGESFCFALSKFILSDLPVFYNNFGAFKDRIKDNNNFIKNNENENEYYNFETLRKNYSKFLNKILEGKDNFNKQIIKFVVYFPQFHEILENNINFYKGYDDFVNLNHSNNVIFEENKINYKTNLPNNKYLGGLKYNILNENLINKQVEILNEYNINGLAMYYYWFSVNTISNNKLIMFNIIEKFLEKNINIFFIWANENWSDNPAFGNSRHIIKNEYDDIDEHSLFLIKCFKNKNYYKIKNKPVFYIHHPWQMELSKLNEFYNKLDLICKQNNFDGIHLKLNSQILYMKINLEFLNNKQYYDFNPIYKANNNSNIFVGKSNCSTLLDYSKYIDNLTQNFNTQTIFFDFDNYARLIKPDKLSKRTKCINNDICNHIRYINKIKKYFNSKSLDNNDPFILLINAFNEWGEKMHIEPSEDNGTYYLDIIKNFI